MNKTFQNKTEKLVDLYGFDKKEIKLNNNEYSTYLVIEGYEYYCFWSKNESKNININNFLVDYRAIIDSENKNNDFKNEEVYEGYYKELEKELNSIGVTFYSIDDKDYDSLMSYTISIDNILNPKYMQRFTNILENYSNKFEKELNFLIK